MAFLYIIDNMSDQLIPLKEASTWASDFLKREISVSNISYLMQYGKIKKYSTDGVVKVNILSL